MGGGPASGGPVRVGPYRIVRRLGAGGMGVVYLGLDDDAGSAAAVKLIRPEHLADPVFRARLHREVAAAQRVPRFCTAPVLAADLDADPPWVATEYIDASSLDLVLLENGRLAGSELESFAVGVAVALRAIHAQGVIHRDLKPSNVLLSRMGPRVIDFGIARVVGAETELTQAGSIIGTPSYMSPEQVRGEPLTPAVDIFAWAGLVTYAATGRPAFGSGPAALVAIVSHEPDLGDLAEPLRSLAADAFAKDPAGRPKAAGLVDRLARSAAVATTRVLSTAAAPVPTPVPAPAGTPVPTPAGAAAPQPGGRRRWRRIAVAALAVLVLAAGGLTAATWPGLWPGPGDRADPPAGPCLQGRWLMESERRVIEGGYLSLVQGAPVSEFGADGTGWTDYGTETRHEGVLQMQILFQERTLTWVAELSGELRFDYQAEGDSLTLQPTDDTTSSVSEVDHPAVDEPVEGASGLPTGPYQMECDADRLVLHFESETLTYDAEYRRA